MARKSIAAVLTEAAGRAKKDKRIEVLHQNDHVALRIFLAVALNPHVKWDLPDEDPEYKPNELPHDQEGVLYNEMRKLYLFLKPNHIYKEYNPNLDQKKRQQLFIQLLEQVDREDAKFLMAAKHKKLPVKLSRETIEEAFPGLLTWNGQ
jgi:hypothetical protein